MNRIFKDDRLEQQLCDKGYLKIPLLDTSRCDEILAYYKKLTKGEHVQNSKYGLYVTLEEFETEKSMEVERHMDDLLLHELNAYFEPFKTHLGGFLVKQPDPNGFTYPHQDWTFVDHDLYRSVTVWIALMPITKENSTLGFVSGSVPYFNEMPVGTPVTVLKSGTFGHEKSLYEHLDIVDLQPGEAMVFDNRMVHAATPNVSSEDRVAYALTLSPPEAQLIHFIEMNSPEGQHKVAKLAVDRKFFHDYTIDKADEYYDLEQLPGGYDVLEMTEKKFEAPDTEYIAKMISENGLKKNGISLEESGQAESTEKTPDILNSIRKWFKVK